MRELAERVNRIANVLTRDLGLVPGNRVLLRGANSPMMVAAYLAVIKAGGVVVATMPLLRAKRTGLPDPARRRSRWRCATSRLRRRWTRRRGAGAASSSAIVCWGGGAADAISKR